MVLQTVTLGGRKFVIVPERDYRRLEQEAEAARAQDAGDVAEAERRRAKGPSRPYSRLRAKLGLR